MANGNRNTVSVINTDKGTAIELIDVGLTVKAPPGSTPNALALSADGKTLYVANADNNVLAVLNVAGEAAQRRTASFPRAGIRRGLFDVRRQKIGRGQRQRGRIPSRTPLWFAPPSCPRGKPTIQATTLIYWKALFPS